MTCSTNSDWSEQTLANYLCIAIDNRNIKDILKLLSEKEANPNAIVPEDGIAPLHLSSGHKNEEFGTVVTEIFLMNGGDPNVVANDGITPLQIAVAWDKASIVQLLLSYGADPMLKDGSQRTAFDYGWEQESWKSLKVLKKFIKSNQNPTNNRNYKIQHEKLQIHKNDVKAEYKINCDTFSTYNKSEKETKGTQTSFSTASLKSNEQNETGDAYVTAKSQIISSQSNESHNWCKLPLKELMQAEDDLKNVTEHEVYGAGDTADVKNFPVIHTSTLRKSSTKSHWQHQCDSLYVKGNTKPSSAKLQKKRSAVFDDLRMYFEDEKEDSEIISECKIVHSTSEALETGDILTDDFTDDSLLTEDNQSPVEMYETAIEDINDKRVKSLLSASKLDNEKKGHVFEDELCRSSSSQNKINRTFQSTKKNDGYCSYRQSLNSVKENTRSKTSFPSTDAFNLQNFPSHKLNTRPPCDGHPETSTMRKTGRERSETTSAKQSPWSHCLNPCRCLLRSKKHNESYDTLESVPTPIQTGQTPPSEVSENKKNDFSPKNADTSCPMTLKSNISPMHIDCSTSSATDSKMNDTNLSGLEHTNDNYLSNRNNEADTFTSESDLLLYDTEYIRQELKKLGFTPGPILGPRTRKLYLNKLKNMHSGKSTSIKNPNKLPAFSSELEQVLKDESGRWMVTLNKWASLENNMVDHFRDTASSVNLRSGTAKTSFTYLLLDPRVTKNLPVRQKNMDSIDVWQTFVESIFYIGKGTGSRQYEHLNQALLSWCELKKCYLKPPSTKVKHIIEIWADKKGVICLQAFNNLLPAEGFTREAAMIDAIGLARLKNEKAGSYYGLPMNWSRKNKRRLGTYLLYRAMKIFINDNEVQLEPKDIQ